MNYLGLLDKDHEEYVRSYKPLFAPPRRKMFEQVHSTAIEVLAERRSAAHMAGENQEDLLDAVLDIVLKRLNWTDAQKWWFKAFVKIAIQILITSLLAYRTGSAESFQTQVESWADEARYYRS